MKENQLLLRTLVEYTVAYLEKQMTAFHEYALAALKTCIRRKLSTMYANTECCLRPGMRLQYIVCC